MIVFQFISSSIFLPSSIADHQNHPRTVVAGEIYTLVQGILSPRARKTFMQRHDHENAVVTLLGGLRAKARRRALWSLSSTRPLQGESVGSYAFGKRLSPPCVNCGSPMPIHSLHVRATQFITSPIMRLGIPSSNALNLTNQGTF